MQLVILFVKNVLRTLKCSMLDAISLSPTKSEGYSRVLSLEEKKEFFKWLDETLKPLRQRLDEND